MTIQTIYAEKTVSVTEVRKNPCQYFIEEPVAVLSNNKTAGYMVSKDMFESMLELIDSKLIQAKFRLSKDRLKELAALNEEYLLSASDDDLNEFIE